MKPMKIKNIDIKRCMNRNEQSIPHWNLNGIYTKCHGTEKGSENILKQKSIRSAYRKSQTKLMGEISILLQLHSQHRSELYEVITLEFE